MRSRPFEAPVTGWSAAVPDRPRGSLRLRTTLGATAVVSVALALGGALLLQLLTTSLTDSAARAAELRARELLGLIEGDIVLGDLALDSGPTSFVQVLDRSGAVAAASVAVLGRPPLIDPRHRGVVRLDPGPIGDGEPFVAVARAGRDGRWTVVAGRSLEPVSDSAEVVTTALLVGVPLLTALVAMMAWVITGRALRPVEAVRREVATISSAQLDRRVPVPPGDDEVVRLAVTMNAMLDRLQSARATQQRFVADASHELRNPIATIRSQLEVALAHPASTSLEELATDLLAEDLRLGRLVEDLLLLARADEDVRAAPARPVDVDDLVLAEAGKLRRRGRVEVDTAGVTAARVSGDASALARLVRNLADNAERHASHRVTLSLRTIDGRAHLEVADDGEGIAPEDRERVFHRFTRLDAARSRDAGGSGLGLAIVREVARAHSGSVELADGPGTRVVVTLPLEG